MKKNLVLLYQFLGGDGGRTQDQWGKTEFLFKENLSLLRGHRDWFSLVPLNSSSSKLILYNMRTPAVASAPLHVTKPIRSPVAEQEKLKKAKKHCSASSPIQHC